MGPFPHVYDADQWGTGLTVWVGGAVSCCFSIWNENVFVYVYMVSSYSFSWNGCACVGVGTGSCVCMFPFHSFFFVLLYAIFAPLFACSSTGSGRSQKQKEN